jgi:predicted GH43/DUF377 family glycosyl hydrolase
VFNPAAVVREGHVYLLLRGEDEVGPYSGTSRIGLATSDDGMAFSVEPEPVLHPANDLWQPWEWPGGCEDPRVVESPDVHRVPGQRVLRPVLAPRRGRFDSLVVEPGPPAVKTEDGIVLIYNGAHAVFDGHGVAASVAYQPGEALFDGDDFASPIALVTAPLPFDGEFGALHGQVDNVCFAQGLVLFNDTWHLYYGMADSRIGCATAPRR